MLFAHAYPGYVRRIVNVEGNFTLDDAFWSASVGRMTPDEADAMLDGFRTEPLAWLSSAVAFQILMLATVLNFIGLIVNGVVILAASHFGERWTGRRHRSRIPRYVLGSVFAGLAFRLAVASRD
ncbi:hypothetical protein OKW28_001548 [Paraburkholderia sp. 40]